MVSNPYVIAYHKKYLKQISLALNIKYDSDIIAWLETVDNKQGYIKDLIRADIQKARH